MKRALALAAALLVLLPVLSQETHVLRQRKFPKTIPAGNYSGIAPLGNNRYAVVCDKSVDGFFVFHIIVDTISGHIISADNEGFRSSGESNRDQEAVVVNPHSHHVFISGEKDNEIHEYSADGALLAKFPMLFAKTALPNRGLESLTYDTSTHSFFTTTEAPLKGDSVIRIQQLDSLLRPCRQFVYRLDAPKHRKKRRNVVVNGVSELCALGDGRLLVMEREIHMPALKTGASVRVSIYQTTPGVSPLTNSEGTPHRQNGIETDTLKKTLLCQFTTRLNIFSRKFANYEGLCVAGRKVDGSIVLLLIADSQNRYRGYMRDWMRTIILPPISHK